MSRFLVRLERRWDALTRRRGTPHHLRVVSYGGHGSAAGVVVRGRVVDDPPLAPAVEGEGALAAVRRSVRSFLTSELPGVELRVEVGGVVAETVTDADGYFVARLAAGDLVAPWTTGRVDLAAPYRGVATGGVDVAVRVPAATAAYGIVSDVDDTVLETGVQRVVTMVRRTLTGSALTRDAFPGAAALYRDLAGPDRPVFYVSSSPWNLHDFVVAFLAHHGFPAGPVLLRDLVGQGAGREPKHDRLREILARHPDLDVVLIGDSGEHDPQIYADIVREHPGRVRAVYIREVRLDPGDGRVEAVLESTALDETVPMVLAADSEAFRRHALDIGLLER